MTCIQNGQTLSVRMFPNSFLQTSRDHRDPPEMEFLRWVLRFTEEQLWMLTVHCLLVGRFTLHKSCKNPGSISNSNPNSISNHPIKAFALRWYAWNAVEVSTKCKTQHKTKVKALELNSIGLSGSKSVRQRFFGLLKVVFESPVRSSYLVPRGSNRDQDRLAFIPRPKIT